MQRPKLAKERRSEAGAVMGGGERVWSHNGHAQREAKEGKGRRSQSLSLLKA